jgi:large subunit ribosomal protein L10
VTARPGYLKEVRFLPSEAKFQQVEQLRKLIEESTVLISADYTGAKVAVMTDLRRALRDRGVEFRVVKNRLIYLAADAAGKQLVKDIVRGPTGIAVGFGDPVEPAKALADFIRNTRAPLKITGGVMGERALSAQEVGALAALPSRDDLIARLLGHMQAPVAGLVNVLNAPVAALARLLRRHIEATEAAYAPEDTAAADAPEGTAAAGAPVDTAAADAPEATAAADAPDDKSPEE